MTVFFGQPSGQPAATVQHAAQQKQDGRGFDLAHRAGSYTGGHQQRAADLTDFEHGLSVHSRIVAPRSQSWQL